MKAGLVCLLALIACVRDPVEWGDVSYRSSKLGDPDTRSAILSANLPSTPDTISACIRSIQSVGGRASDIYRVWWNAKPDSNGVLLAQRSPDSGATWQPPTIVDGRDRGRRGCERPPPAVFFDSTNGYLHIVYFIETSDGAGVFFAHSMDRGLTFHTPVAVVYGNARSAASVAANGDSVVVVFEDPNSTQPRIGIALSRTLGHSFEQRAQATPDDARAVRPWVALDHDRITVSWKSAANGIDSAGDLVGIRVGHWR